MAGSPGVTGIVVIRMTAKPTMSTYSSPPDEEPGATRTVSWRRWVTFRLVESPSAVEAAADTDPVVRWRQAVDRVKERKLLLGTCLEEGFFLGLAGTSVRIALSGEHAPFVKGPFALRLPKPCRPKTLIEAISGNNEEFDRSEQISLAAVPIVARWANG